MSDGPLIEEVGARLVLLGKQQYITGMGEARKAGSDWAASTVKSSKVVTAALGEAAKAQDKVVAAYTDLAAVQGRIAATSRAAADAAVVGNKESAAAAKAQLLTLKEQEKAARANLIAANNAKRGAAAQVTALRAHEKASLAAAAGTGRLSTAVTNFGKVGKVAFAGAITGAAWLGYEGVKRMSTFEDALSRVSTLAGVQKSWLPSLQTWIVKSSPGMREDVTTIADQMYRIASANSGLKLTKASLEAMTRAAAQLSVLGGPLSDPEQTARVFGIVRASGIKGYKSYQDIGAISAATVGAGDMQMGDLIGALGTGGLIATAAKHRVSLQELGAVLADLGDLGINGSRAGNSLAHALSLIASPSSTAAKAFQAVGLHPTQLGYKMQQQGLLPALNLLQGHLSAAAGTKAMSRGDLISQLGKYGFTGSQITNMMKSRPDQVEQNLLLTRMFGGAKQSIPIISLLDTLVRTHDKLDQINRSTVDYSAKLGVAMNTPTQVWKRWDLDLHQVQNEIGMWLIPKIEALGNWLSKHKQLIKDIAIATTTLLIPAMGIWLGRTIAGGIVSLGRFVGLIQETNTGVGSVGRTARAQQGGLGALNKAVIGVTTAVGVWELGKATSGHGAGGAVTAGLGGAVSGMVAGFSVGGPFGAAIGAAGGALVGLAGHFFGTAQEVDRATISVQNFAAAIQSALAADKGKVGAQTRDAISQWLTGHPGFSHQLASAGVNWKDLRKSITNRDPDVLRWWNMIFRDPKDKHDKTGFSPYQLADAPAPFLNFLKGASKEDPALGKLLDAYNKGTMKIQDVFDATRNLLSTMQKGLKGQIAVYGDVQIIAGNGPVRGHHGKGPKPQHRARGGGIRGFGTDTVPAMLTPGEYVINRRSTRRWFPLLHAINARGYASGGVVTPTRLQTPQINLNGILNPGVMNAQVTQATGNMATSTEHFYTQVGKNMLGLQNMVANTLTRAISALQRTVSLALSSIPGAGGGGGGAGLNVPGAPTNAHGAVALGQQMAAQRGWTGAEWNALYRLWMQESGWNANAVNPSSGAAGIPQALGHGHVFNLGDAQAQIAWGLNYISGRYGDPLAAWSHEVSNNWYARGGAVGGDGASAFTPSVSMPSLSSLLPDTRGSDITPAGGGDVHVHFHGPVMALPAVRRELMKEISAAVAQGQARRTGYTGPDNN